MRKRLCIGIQHLDSEWQAVLNQIGVWFEEAVYSEDLATKYSALILNEKPDAEQLNFLNTYLEHGGAILELSGCSAFFNEAETHSYKAKTVLTGSDHKAFKHIPYIDFFSTIRVHRNSSLFEGLVYFKSTKNGALAYFGAPIHHLVQKAGYTRKRFYSPKGSFPDEIVSKVSKHELIEAFTATLKELHVQQSIPFVRKWTSPYQEPVFCFRIDSDFGDQESVKKLYSVLNSNQISATWFLHVQAHEDWLDTFQTFESQEMALHGYEHGTTSSASRAWANIQKGKQLMEEAGFQPEGFCAPYGINNKAIEESLSQFDFKYSSEFSFAYDGLPLQSTGNSQPLQIPIHPICTGSLTRQKYSVQDMTDYFFLVLQNRIARFEPVLFYHHPLQPGLTVISKLLEKVNTQKLKNITFLEFATFWQSRQTCSFNIWFESGKVKIEEQSDPQLYLQVSFDHQSFSLIKKSNDRSEFTKTSEFEYSNSYLPKPDEVKNMCSRVLQLTKTSLLDWKNRIQL